MNNREWLYSLDVADLADWFDAEHVDANDTLSAENDVIADVVDANDANVDSREQLESWAHEEIAEKWAQSDREVTMIMDDLLDMLDRQADITSNETSHDNPYVGLVRGKQWERTERSDYYCGKCGWKVTDHNSYCPECGGALHGAPNKPDGKFDARETAESAENVTSKNEIHNFDDSREQLEAEYAEPHKVNMKRYFKPFIEAAQRAIDVENDSREKLEDDVVHECARPGFGPEFGEIMAWLDRQAAIAERETKLRELHKFEENHRYHIRSIEEVNQKLNKRIAELTAERDEMKAFANRLECAAHDKLGVTLFGVDYVTEDFMLHVRDTLTAERDGLKAQVNSWRERNGGNMAMVDSLAKQVNELRAERDELREKLADTTEAISELMKKQPRTFDPHDVPGSLRLAGRYIDELELRLIGKPECDICDRTTLLEEVEGLTAERDELREKLSEAIGHAHEIGKLGDLELKVRVV